MTRLIALIAATLLTATAMAGDKDKDKTHEVDGGDVRLAGQERRPADQQDRSGCRQDAVGQLRRADTNGDGYLSKSEFTAKSKT